ncbi:universal stress protein [Gillisia sp. M10.2A]|uniref:Universal stress protein n=1 Tax=Gillisia lutea TaxID=2909668 RepID=A0ABS9EEM8_9FLAO|nr:universal stress protein [Gillisia lutea]MCF4100230.1 universal stress protein [Gillisia lutea]
MKNILLPTDFSETSNNAIEYALKFFKDETCTFHLLSIYKVWEYTTDNLMQASPDNSLYESLLSESKKKLAVLAEELEKRSITRKFKFNTITDYDVFTDAINQVIELKNIDLIVMGSDGATGAVEILFGSHVLRVSRKVDCPLLIIPKDYVFRQPKNILLTIDYDTYFDPAAVKPLMDLIFNKKLHLHALRMMPENIEPAEKSIEKMKVQKHFKEAECSYYTLQGVSTEDAVYIITQVLKMDMNLMLARKKLFIERFLYGSHISKIIYRTRIPLLMINEDE